MKNRSEFARDAVSRIALVSFLVVSMPACDGDEGMVGKPSGGNASDAGGTTPPASSDGVDEATLARCPQSSTLIETTEWMSCLAGKRISGVEPFNNAPCELRIGSDGVFEYLRGGAVAIAVPERSRWRSATGTYQNAATSGSSSRIFLAGVAPDLEAVDGAPRVTSVDLSFFSLASMEDTIEVKYLDAALVRQTYNCKVNAL